MARPVLGRVHEAEAILHELMPQMRGHFSRTRLNSLLGPDPTPAARTREKLLGTFAAASVVTVGGIANAAGIRVVTTGAFQEALVELALDRRHHLQLVEADVAGICFAPRQARRRGAVGA